MQIMLEINHLYQPSLTEHNAHITFTSHIILVSAWMLLYHIENNSRPAINYEAWKSGNGTVSKGCLQFEGPLSEFRPRGHSLYQQQLSHVIKSTKCKKKTLILATATTSFVISLR